MNVRPLPDASNERLCALPAQLLSVEGAVILTRGVIELWVRGERAAEVVPAVLAAASGAGISRRELVDRFAAPDREMVEKLLDDLISRSILVRSSEQPPVDDVEPALDVFYWHFGQTARTTLEKLNAKPIAIMGVNSISRRIAESLRSLGVEGVQVVDFHILRNLRLHDAAGNLKTDEWPSQPPVPYETWAESLADQEMSCLVATSDFGGSHLMLEWNRFCIENRIDFLPVVLERFTGTIGPFVIPGETACYECLRRREDSNMDAPEIERIPETGAPERQAVTGFHPAMANVLGEIAAMELCKIYGGGLPWHPNRIIEVNLMAPAITPRRVLKLPLCPVCSPAVKTSSMYIEKESFVPGHETNPHDFQ